MTTTLSFQFRHGKSPVNVEVSGDTNEEAFSQYTSALHHIEQLGCAQAVTTSKLTAPADIPSEQPAPVKAPGKREQKKSEELAARNANENALKWLNRVAVAIPHFAGKQPQTIAEEIGSRKAMALMTAQESNELIKTAQDALTVCARNHADVDAYLIIMAAVDSLETGTKEEWEEKKQPIGADKWAYLGQNPKLYEAAKTELEATMQLLQVAAMAG